MKCKYLILLISPLIFNLYGCASIVSGQSQIVSVSTPFCPDAECTLTNPEGTYYVKTPGTLSIDREYDDLTVACKKEGFQPSNISVSSSTKGMAFGNILLGGVIGAGVDMGTGAAYDYPSEIINPLDCRTTEQITAAPKTGHYDKEALALVEPGTCGVPRFVVLDGEEEIYRSDCPDGNVGVITCSNSICRPANISATADKN
jgi:hypothetical protein